ncbi:tetraspanin-4 isoform X2 [Anomalospiza imberbis]
MFVQFESQALSLEQEPFGFQLTLLLVACHSFGRSAISITEGASCYCCGRSRAPSNCIFCVICKTPSYSEFLMHTLCFLQSPVCWLQRGHLVNWDHIKCSELPFLHQDGRRKNSRCKAIGDSWRGGGRKITNLSPDGCQSSGNGTPEATMRRSSTDESTYHRSPSLDSKDYSFPNGAFRRYSSMYGGQFGAASNSFFGFHTNPGPKATKAKYTTPKGNKYVVFYLDLSFIFLLELKRCSMAHNCLQCIKYLMFVFNLLFWLGGCGILGVGIWLAVTQGNFATLSSSFPSLSAANLLIVTGTFVMIIGFVGCIGAIKENKCLLLSFFIMLLIIFLLELTVVILFFVYTDKIDKYAQRDLKKGLHLYGTDGNIGLTNAWSIIQTDFRCCGVSNYTDWFEVYNTTRVPDSCCLEFSENCGLHSPGTWWKAPCYETVKVWLQENLLAVGIFGLCTAMVQVLQLEGK